MHLQIENEEKLLDVILQDDHALIIVTDYEKDVSTSFKVSKENLDQLKDFFK